MAQQPTLPDEASGWNEDERDRATKVLTGHAVVVNVRKNGPHWQLVPWLNSHGLLVYVGHSSSRHSWPGSAFASPFVREAKSDREAMVRHYDNWLDDQPELVQRIRNGELSHRALGCWCAPKQCHADVLVRRAEKQRS